MLKNLKPILFWSFLWGIIEATAGYGLHLIPAKIGWLFWAPIAFYFLNKVYQKTKSPLGVFLTAVISAMIKLVDLFLPVRIDMVMNPAISILIEGFVMVLYFELLEKYPNYLKYKLIKALGFNTLWRILYLCYILLMPNWMIEISPLKSGSALFKFLCYQNIITTALLFVYLKHQIKLHNTLQKQIKNYKQVEFFNIIKQRNYHYIGLFFMFFMDVILNIVL